ncbi:MAG: ABC transporter ATP-binding protein [Paracoccaceae bacterium]|nr:ABC transporter ATP-binding protein [Paracoccaceae bacterium]
MIQLRNLCKTHAMLGRRKIVSRNIHVTFPAGVTVGLLGRNGAGKSTLLQMIAGTMDPDRGEVIRHGSVSWPVGFAGSFHPDLTGVQNVRFVARAYGVDSDDLTDFVEDFAELGDHFDLPLRSYSTGMRARLAFGCSMGIRFDTYLVDEVTSVGDPLFRRKSEAVFRARTADSGAIVVSHSLDMLEKLCQSGAVLEDGRLTFYPKIGTAIANYRRLLGLPQV